MEKFLPILFAISFPIVWVSVSLLLSRLSGWTKLTSHYADNSDKPGKTCYMRSGSVGKVPYRSCLILRTCETGLRLSVLFPFRIGHPPLFIPWDQFHGLSRKRVLFATVLKTSVGMPVIANVTLPIWVHDHLPENQKIE
ncbi:MAG TPA: hypothetical protein PLB10_01435 [Thiolinea sp.]|nr:hypothetical protein [Thiolinea sp.]